jgi:hypothetical protein
VKNVNIYIYENYYYFRFHTTDRRGQSVGKGAASDLGFHRNLFSAGTVGSVLPSWPQSEKFVSYIIASDYRVNRPL